MTTSGGRIQYRGGLRSQVAVQGAGANITLRPRAQATVTLTNFSANLLPSGLSPI